jgi:hypothetical protein
MYVLIYEKYGRKRSLSILLYSPSVFLKRLRENEKENQTG